MITVNLIDEAFRHLTCSVHGKTAKRIRYVRDRNEWDGVTLITDDWLATDRPAAIRSPVKIGWLLECREYKPRNYELAEKQLQQGHIQRLLTHDAELLKRYPARVIFTPFGGSWIQAPQMYAKTKHVSHILSTKNFMPGHRLRHQIAHAGLPIDCYGFGVRRWVARKEEALAPYQFSIAIENSQAENYFTEKLLDCFACGTIPIYWGCPNLQDFGFDMRGVLRFESMDDLRSVLGWIKCGDEAYASLFMAAARNLEAMRQYEIIDDWIAVHVLEPMMEGR